MSDNKKKSLQDLITTSLHSLVGQRSGNLINPDSKHSINTETLNMILTEIRGKLTGLEHSTELRSKISECRTLLKDIAEFNVNIREDVEYIRELLTSVVDDVESNYYSDEPAEGDEDDDDNNDGNADNDNDDGGNKEFNEDNKNNVC